MRRLKAESLVELDAHRDSRVTELKAEEARDLFEVRCSLDPTSGNPDYAHLLHHRRFHAAIYRASHNDR